MRFQLEIDATPEQIDAIKSSYSVVKVRKLPVSDTLAINLKDVYTPAFTPGSPAVAVAAAEAYDPTRPVKVVVAHINGAVLGAWDVTGEDWVPVDLPESVQFHPRHRASYV